MGKIEDLFAHHRVLGMSTYVAKRRKMLTKKLVKIPFKQDPNATYILPFVISVSINPGSAYKNIESVIIQKRTSYVVY